VVSVSARPHRAASGVALGGDLVLTADHAIERDRDVSVVADGTRRDATVAGRDPATDLAVLRVSGFDAPRAPVSGIPTTGSLVISVSRTASGTVSAGLGVITSVGGPLRTARGVVLPSIIRTDAALRPGTAGGALVDVQGNIVGITTPGLLRGLPVAIPAEEAAQIAERLATHRPLGRGFLGLSVQGVTLAARQQDTAPGGRGLLVFGVARSGSADRAGIIVGDVLLGFNERTLGEPEDLQDSLVGIAPGTEVSVRLLRGGAVQEVAITVGERPAA
jgi:S1-C subfamily serine protease